MAKGPHAEDAAGRLSLKKSGGANPRHLARHDRRRWIHHPERELNRGNQRDRSGGDHRRFAPQNHCRIHGAGEREQRNRRALESPDADRHRQIGESEQRDRAGDCVATLQGAPRQIPHENRADRQPCRVRQPVVRLAFPQRLKLGDRFQPSLAAKKMQAAENRSWRRRKREHDADAAEN